MCEGLESNNLGHSNNRLKLLRQKTPAAPINKHKIHKALNLRRDQDSKLSKPDPILYLHSRIAQTWIPARPLVREYCVQDNYLCEDV